MEEDEDERKSMGTWEGEDSRERLDQLRMQMRSEENLLKDKRDQDVEGERAYVAEERDDLS